MGFNLTELPVWLGFQLFQALVFGFGHVWRGSGGRHRFLARSWIQGVRPTVWKMSMREL